MSEEKNEAEEPIVSIGGIDNNFGSQRNQEALDQADENGIISTPLDKEMRESYR